MDVTHHLSRITLAPLFLRISSCWGDAGTGHLSTHLAYRPNNDYTDMWHLLTTHQELGLHFVAVRFGAGLPRALAASVKSILSSGLAAADSRAISAPWA